MEKTIIEVRGMKMEIDLSTARRIDNYKVGDSVKVLRKEYGDRFVSNPGVIVGFDNFENLPTIVVAYLKLEYSSAQIDFVYINSQTKDIEICHMADAEKVLDRSTAVEALDREISKQEMVLQDLKAKKSYFMKNFRDHFDKALQVGKEVPGALEAGKES